MTPVQIGLCVVAGLIVLGIAGFSLKGIPGRVVAFFTTAKASGLGVAVGNAIDNSPVLQKLETIDATGRNIIGYTEMKITSTIIPLRVDPDKKAETEAAFGVILTNLANAKTTREPIAQTTV